MELSSLENEKYYKKSVEKVIELFNSSVKSGLNKREANKRLRKFGSNKIKNKDKRTIFTIFFEQFKDFMIIILITATIISFFMGELLDTVVIFSIVILNAFMGFMQEYKAEKSLEKLKEMASPLTKVIRDGEIIEEKSEYLVVGDIVLLKKGDKIPADGRIIESHNFSVDQSIITGESLSCEKNEKKLYANNISPADRSNMVFMGSTVVTGKAKAIIVRTSDNTEMGKIAKYISENTRTYTPLQKKLKVLGKYLVLFSILITLLITFIGIIKGNSFYQMILAGISLAVAAIPEGLPAIVTLVLALGVQKMTRKNAVVRKLPAVETLGCTTVICSDKTGTLTKNSMTVKKLYYNNKIRNLNNVDKSEELNKMLAIGSICNGCEIKNKGDKSTFTKIRNIFSSDNKVPKLIGDPTDKALIKVVYKLNFNLNQFSEKTKIIKENEFDSAKRRMSILIKNKNKKEIWIKGALETILNKSNYIQINGVKHKLNKKIKKEIINSAEVMANDALRIIAVAYRKINKRIKNDDLEKIENNLTFVGFFALMDPPRKEAIEAVQKCKLAGIRSIMVTGDHPLTAKVIAKKVGIIGEYDQVVDGSDFDEITDKQLNTLVKNRRVFARINPENKLRIVKALQERNEIVAMTGDGVNDAPALQKADIGIAMGKSGSDVSREVASLILTDDNFSTIVSAIEEGRKIYNNIRKFIKYLLSCNIGELLAIFLGICTGLPIPLLAIQILWVNLVTDGLPALALGVEDSNDDVMEKAPRKTDENFLAPSMLNRIIWQGAFIGLSTFLIYILALFRLNLSFNIARTMAFSVLVFSQLIFVFSCRSEKKYFWLVNPLSNIFLIFSVIISALMQIAVIYIPQLSLLFKTQILTIDMWLYVIAFSLFPTIILEFFFKNNN